MDVSSDEEAGSARLGQDGEETGSILVREGLGFEAWG